MDNDKIIADQKYNLENIYQTLERAFSRYHLYQEKKSDGTLVFLGKGNAKDYGAFGCLITSLREKVWFMEYVIRWIWYNSDDGQDENDFAVEDVLYHYTKKESVV